MPRPKKERGRPMERRYPPRIDATPEQIAKTMFQASLTGVPDVEEHTYRCIVCRRAVYYPETLYDAGNCKNCTIVPLR